ncbi:MAG: PDZ domain-containing protein, partial [Pedobacter sp.]
GASSTFQNGKILLTRLNQGSPANLAGLKVSDQVVAINAVKVNSANEYNLELFKYNPGDEVVFELVRNSEIMNIKVKLEQRPPANHWADMFSGGKSAILDGFEKVFSHDAVIKPKECGGPVLDRNGNLYGLNIARFSRTSCIALPTSILMEFIRKSLARMK